MNQWFKNQRPSEEAEGHTAEKEEVRLQDRDESADMNPKGQTLFQEKHMTSDKSESDEGLPHSPALKQKLMTEHFSAANTMLSSDLFYNTHSPGTRTIFPSLSQIICAENKTSTRSVHSSPDMKLKPSFEEFTPVITPDFDDETYRFQCSCPGLYLCSVTGLMFDMKGEGDVVYRIVPWNRRLLRQHHKKPAGPLFDITCVQQSVCQLHLPHCEISSTGGCQFLSVAHVKDDEDVEYISPREITETHVVTNTTGFSGYGNVKEEDSPPHPVRALVLLFYRPPADPDLTSFLSVLLLPRNIVLRDVQRKRKASVGDERYIETSSHCKLCPDQFYTLSTCP
uniref:FIIND domain-containing protein n=1 Tax=Anabas testudineus TaxID=64144 RepID=A0A7N6F990_ANATE